MRKSYKVFKIPFSKVCLRIFEIFHTFAKQRLYTLRYFRMKIFNTVGTFRLNEQYMVDITARLEIICNMVAKGDCFVSIVVDCMTASRVERP